VIVGKEDIEIRIIEIIDKKKITHNTSQFRLKIPPDMNFEYLPGDHVKIYPDKDNRKEFRPYTPTTIPGTEGYFELIIKHYPGGLVSGYMKGREVGDSIAVSGPDPGGHFVDGMAKRIGMVAGGSGITPMISMIRSILGRKLDVEISLIYANKTVDDIILREELDRYADQQDNFQRYYVVGKAPDGWDMGIGRIDVELMNRKLPAPSDDTTIFVCGPPMMQLDLRRKLLEIGYPKDSVIFP
jgi:cytochrome-b5 reductase